MDNLNIKNLILRDRESRVNFIKTFLKKHNVICLKANIVGEHKNTNYSYVVTKYFEKKIDDFIKEKNIDLIDKVTDVSLDGNYVLYLFNKKIHLKDEMVKLEESEEIGRLVDIDVYESISEGIPVSLSRGSNRKCLLCDEAAFVCQRKQTHTLEELKERSEKIVHTKLKTMVTTALKKSMMYELNLDPKFGLVTKKTNGAHRDMTYELLEKTQDVIIPYLFEMFEVGYKTRIRKIYPLIKEIGIKADEAMFKATNGINVYKGVIFSLGIICASLGYKMNSLYIKCASVLNLTKDISKKVLDEYDKHDTFGSKAYTEYKIGGARLEAYNGFPNVRNCCKYLTDLEDSSLLKALIYLIVNLEDTVMLKRAKTIDKYYDIKLKFSEINLDNKLDSNLLEKLNKQMVDENISFGGCADMLICAVFLRLIQNDFNIKL